MCGSPQSSSKLSVRFGGAARETYARRCTHVGRGARSSAVGSSGRRRAPRPPSAAFRWAAAAARQESARRGARGRGRRRARAHWARRRASSSGDRSVSQSGKRARPAETILPAGIREASLPARPNTRDRYTLSRPFRTSPSTYINVITVHEPPQSAPSPPPSSRSSSRQIQQSPSTSTSRTSLFSPFAPPTPLSRPPEPWIPSCPGAIRSMHASAVQVTSTSRPPPLVSPPRPCATSSAPSLTLSRILRRGRCASLSSLLFRSPPLSPLPMQGFRHRDAVVLLSLHALPLRPRTSTGTVRHFPASARLSILTFRSSEWDRIKSPSDDKIVPYANLPSGSPQNLNKLAVLKVNGGLGTSMGASSIPYFHECSGPHSPQA